MTDLNKEIEAAAAALAGAEITFQRAYSNYLEGAEAFRRASAERDRLHAELLTLKQKRARIEAEDETISFCEAGI